MLKKSVILINLPPGSDYTYSEAGSIYPATGLMIIGTILKKNRFFVSLIDGTLSPNYEENALTKLSEDTAFIGFSTMTSQINMAYKLAKRIKEKRPDIKIVLGGVHPTLFPGQTVDNPYIDIAVINEGTKTVLEIMEYINGKIAIDKVRGVAFKDEDGNIKINCEQEFDNIDDIPYFDFELLDIERYLNATSVYERELGSNPDKKIRLMPILTGLGCCFRCAFCINVILKRRYRARTAGSIIKEIKRLRDKYNANAFLFLDEDFCINKSRLSEFVRLIKEENIDLKGRIWARVSYFKNRAFKKLIPEMERVGIRSIAMGAESGSQKILDYVCKDIKKEDIDTAANELAKTKITPRFSFMTGFDGETKDDTMATYKLCAKLLRLNPRTDIAGPFIFRYYPGSPIFNSMVDKYKIKVPKYIEEWKNALNSDGSLSVDYKQWTWPGFTEYSESMGNYIAICSQTLNKLKWRSKKISMLIRSLLLWRVEHSDYLFRLDYLIFPLLKRAKAFLSSLSRKGAK